MIGNTSFEVIEVKIALENLGVIHNSSINIEGITVITGKNNSGKSTLGKTLYSVVSATENLYENATNDLSEFAKSLITKKLRASELSLLFRRIGFSNTDQNEDNSFSFLKSVYNNRYPKVNTLDELNDLIDKVIEATTLLDVSTIEKIINDNPIARLRFDTSDQTIDNLKNDFINTCKDVTALVAKYSDFVEYEQEKLIDTLSVEFRDQITPVKLPDITKAKIEIDKGASQYSMTIDDQNHIFECSGTFPLNEADNVVFIDDVTVIDAANPENVFVAESYKSDDFFSYISSKNHNIALLEKITKKHSFIESIFLEESFRIIEKKINTIIDDEVIVKDNKYVFSSNGLDLYNLAMGAKIFAILKMLLKNGCLNSNTYLILDEPESHLHPEWQNLFAEIIALLVKEIGLKTVITSHSPNFVLAIQTFSQKYGLNDISNYYITQKVDEYRVCYKCVNDNLQLIYADFAKYFSEIKSLYNNLIYGENND